MKQLKVENFLGIKSLDITVGARTLIVGPNGAGKSSVQNAIRFAMCNDPVRVTLKKDAKALINDGAKSATIDIDGSETHIMPSKVIYSGRKMDHSPAVLLDMQSFSKSSLSERAAIINGLAGTLNQESIRVAGTAAGLNSEKLETVLPLVAASIDDAKDSADKEARSLKGEWKGITGEVWGSEKALLWKPDVDPEAAAKLQNLNAKLEELDKELMSTMILVNDWDNHVAPLRASIDGLDAAQQQHDEIASKREAAEESSRENEKELIEGNPFDEICSSLVDVAEAIKKSGESCCPHCSGSILVIDTDAQPGIVKFDDAAAAVLQHADAMSKFDAVLAEAVRLANEQGAMYRSLSKMRDAKARLDEVLSKYPPNFDIAVARKEIEAMKSRKNEMFVRKQQLMNANVHAANADELVKRAAATHKQIEEWLALSEYFSPAGAAAKILGSAVDTINGLLETFSSQVGWGKVVIANDFSLTYAGRDMRLLSESEQWRADAMLTVAINKMADPNGSIPILLDRIDLLDLSGRGELIQWAEQSSGQWVLFGTLKARPNLDGWNSYWIENGFISTAE